MPQFFTSNRESKWINVDKIVWVEEGYGKCLRICTKPNGCGPTEAHFLCPEDSDFRAFLAFLKDNKIPPVK